MNGLLTTASLEEARKQFELPHSEIEKCALECGLLPGRYQRNQKTISVEQQLQLFSSQVAVIGCGGLGGYVIEELARLGVGTIVAIDPDRFEDHNLNRQLFSTLSVIGQPKAKVASERIHKINPAITVTSIEDAFNATNSKDLLSGADVVADAVDNVETRIAIGEACAEMKIPMVHAAIAGWYGHVCSVFPGDSSLQKIYGNHNSGKGIEQEFGNPSFTPAVIAGLEVAEICKILLGKPGVLRHRKLTLDLLDMEIEEIPL